MIPLASENHALVRELVPELRVVISDLDGTLVGKNGNLFADGKGRPSAAASGAIADLATSGIALVLLSGRRRDRLAAIARLVGATGYIAEMGTIVVPGVDGEGSRASELFALGDYPFGDELPYEAMLRTGAVELLLDAFSGRLQFHSPWDEGRETSHLLRGDVNTGEANELLRQEGMGWCRLVENGTIPHGFPGLDVEPVHAYHLVPSGSGKNEGVRVMLDTLGFERSQAAALGDGRADLEVAPEVGAFFLMRNAIELDPEIEAAASGCRNVLLTSAPYGPGWAETVRLLLDTS